ncbi:MFS transporter [Campylobacter sp. MIT 99-7217]|uniref:MFS transporter n=1 Tax=Campylobacter sp. MIT 99-7217 TaxID=535091 RepID=UPI00115B5866|nr:MFS transporter [Campylobacter sp. MIT 99-7217]TQR32423.1 MFS transporter [Campylobacter sp. MIT 99-7217]
MKATKQLSRKEVKILGLSSLGGTLEFYDFIIFVFFAGIISQHFFPAELSDTWKLINTYGIFAAGYLARPLGGIVMAHFGDKFGRKNMFMLSILLMVIPTFALAIVPTYEVIGFVAPIFLILVRICQGIAVGGELPGAWVFVHEHAPQGQKNTYLGFLTASVTAGILLGSLVYLLTYSLFDSKEVQEWAWRVPFALGGVFGIISVYLRRFLEETPVFQQMKNDDSLVKFPLKEVLKYSKFGVVISMLITWVLTCCILIFILLMPNFVSSMPEFAFTPFEKTYFQILGLVAIVSSIILSGVLADKLPPHKVCIAFALGFAFFSFLFFMELYAESKSIVSVIALYFLTCFCAGIMNFCPVFMSDVFEPRVRFSGISFAYNIAYAIAGGFTPQLASYFHTYALKNPQSLIGTYGLSAYVLLVALVALISAFLMASRYKQKAQ